MSSGPRLGAEFSIKKRDSSGTKGIRLTCTFTKPKRPFRSLQFAPALSGLSPDPAPPLCKAKLAAAALLVLRLRCSGWRHGVGRLRRYGRAARALRQSGGGEHGYKTACYGRARVGCSQGSSVGVLPGPCSESDTRECAHGNAGKKLPRTRYTPGYRSLTHGFCRTGG